MGHKRNIFQVICRSRDVVFWNVSQSRILNNTNMFHGSQQAPFNLFICWKNGLSGSGADTTSQVLSCHMRHFIKHLFYFSKWHRVQMGDVPSQTFKQLSTIISFLNIWFNSHVEHWLFIHECTPCYVKSFLQEKLGHTSCSWESQTCLCAFWYRCLSCKK